ncbi:MAG: hydrogenase 4 subunit B [Gammaproteobacteria bacterium]|nr:hydrogenase 4 subunit B [Gammaproteobacteria bacterium]
MNLQGAMAAIGLALLSSLLALLLHGRPGSQRLLAFLALGLSAAASLVAGIAALSTGQAEATTLPLGLPWLAWHLRLDALSGFFLAIIGLVSLPAAVYGWGYCRVYDDAPARLTPMLAFTGLFVAGMQLVLLADDAYAFMIAWELMSLASYFLVASHHERAEARHAAFLYLLMAHAGGLAILLSFGVLAGFGGGFDFASLRASPLNPLWAGVCFGLALAGFGTKAGLVPLHIWLPEAHPVAPSHVSGLLSGVIVKMALYGFIRVVFDLIGEVHWAWGVAVLAIGAGTALYGVLYALVQSDLKRLLAYSTVENMGIVFLGLGLALIYLGNGQVFLGALAFVAALFHALNHACFKSLLFFGAGAVLHQAHETELSRLGGLLNRMPWTGFLFLLGCLSIASLPPFNGFASEWLIFQAALQAGSLDSGVLRASIPVAAAVLALTAALSATTFVKAYGIAFLGQARSPHARHAREADFSLRLGQAILALLCLALGVLPTLVVEALGRVSFALLGHDLPSATAHGWLWLTPVAAQKASYSAPLVFAGILLAVAAWAAVWLILKRKRRDQPVPRVPAWDCGFGELSPRMQYSAASFSMPIQQIFRGVWRIRADSQPAQPEPGLGHAAYRRYALHVEDWLWQALYAPLAAGVLAAARRVALIQTGHLRHYLLYSFFTLVLLLWLLR